MAYACICHFFVVILQPILFWRKMRRKLVYAKYT